MARRNRRPERVGPIYGFAITWLVMAMLLPLYKIWGLLLAVGASMLIAYLIGRLSGSKKAAKPTQAQPQQQQAQGPRVVRADQQAQARPAEKPAAPKKSYGPEIDPILEEGNRALSEMGRLYMSIKDPDVRMKINELMRITDKITQDAIEDPTDIPKIKKFLNYYLPTTIKLLNAYDRMSAQGIEGENLDKSMKSINEMLDAAIAAFKKQLDSLFANQALDIETDIQVMNTMLAREGLIGGNDFEVAQSGGNRTVPY